METYSDINLLAISNLVAELALIGDIDDDLDALLGRMYSVLVKLPQLRLQPKVALYMFDKCKRPVQVAQYGLQPSWLLDPENDPLQSFQTPFSKECVVEKITSLNDYQSLLVLPLQNGADPLGQIVLFTDADWSPTTSVLQFLTNLSSAFSGIINRFLSDEILRVRKNGSSAEFVGKYQFMEV